VSMTRMAWAVRLAKKASPLANARIADDLEVGEKIQAAN